MPPSIHSLSPPASPPSHSAPLTTSSTMPNSDKRANDDCHEKHRKNDIHKGQFSSSLPSPISYPTQRLNHNGVHPTYPSQQLRTTRIRRTKRATPRNNAKIIMALVLILAVAILNFYAILLKSSVQSDDSRTKLNERVSTWSILERLNDFKLKGNDNYDNWVQNTNSEKMEVSSVFPPSMHQTNSNKNNENESILNGNGRKNRDCIVYLVQLNTGNTSSIKSFKNRNSTLYKLNKSLTLLYHNYIYQFPNVDILLFYDNASAPSEDTKQLISHNRPQIQFHPLDETIWNVPPSLADEHYPGYNRRAAKKLKRLQRPAFSMGYRHMMRFFAITIWPHLNELGYQYVMRLDGDSFVHSKITYNLFDYMRRGKKKYGFRQPIMDPNRGEGYDDLIDAFLKEHVKNSTADSEDSIKEGPIDSTTEMKLVNAVLNQDVKNDLQDSTYTRHKKPHRVDNATDLDSDAISPILAALFNHDRRIGFYNNFFMAHVPTFVSPPISTLLNRIDESGVLYTERTGDLVIHSTVVRLALWPKEVQWFRDFTYEHMTLCGIDVCKGCPQTGGASRGPGGNFGYNVSLERGWERLENWNRGWPTDSTSPAVINSNEDEAIPSLSDNLQAHQHHSNGDGNHANKRPMFHSKANITFDPFRQNENQHFSRRLNEVLDSNTLSHHEQDRQWQIFAQSIHDSFNSNEELYGVSCRPKVRWTPNYIGSSGVLFCENLEGPCGYYLRMVLGEKIERWDGWKTPNNGTNVTLDSGRNETVGMAA